MREKKNEVNIKNKELMLENLIHMVSLTHNDYLKKRLEEIKEIINTTTNNEELGIKLKKFLK